MELDKVIEEMHSGRIYYETEELGERQAYYRDILFKFNHTLPSKQAEKQALLQELLGAFGPASYIEPPLHANWGKNTYFGSRVYANSSLTLVDDTRIELHDDVMIGPNVTLCAGTIVLPGVTIGENTVIGAGSLVTKDVPKNVVAYGSPCKVIRSLE